jgi:EAL domain-containing protein (putative c-di-GMP-specific phosphodiesterase class I)
MLPRTLMLMVVWGSAVFLWGTFSAWARHQYIERQRQVSAEYARGAAGWFEEKLQAIKPLAEDQRLKMGLDLAAGVNSLPVQRALYEYSYLHNQQDVYAVELTQRKVAMVASAAPLSQDVVARLNTLRDNYRVVLGTGVHNGVVLLGLKVQAPLPQQVFVLVPLRLDQMAEEAFLPTLLHGMEVGLVMPHASGWAWWRPDSGGFTLDKDLSTAMDQRLDAIEKDKHYSIMTPLGGLTVMLGLRGSGALSKVDLLPHLLVGMWALLMSVFILWAPTRGVRMVVVQQAGPVLRPIQQAWGPVQGLVANLSERIERKVAANLKGQWKEAQVTVPLVNGPGHFASSDFTSAKERVDPQIAELNKRRGSPPPLKGKKGSLPEPDEEYLAPEGVAQRTATLNEAARMNREQETEAAAREDLRTQVKRCIKEKRVHLVYQPVFRVADDMPVLHEVFARLISPTGREIMPGEFLPIATEHKLTLDLDMAVFEKVLADHFEGGRQPVTPLALNISSTSLDGVSYLKAMVATGPRVLQKLAFEVRSQEMVRDPKALRLLKDMQQYGGHLAVDYFGGGEAMLEASKRMGFDYVKIDCNAFTGNLEAKKELIRLCQSAQRLGLATILEKVGTQSVAAFARRTGAPYLQGYALSVPQAQMVAMSLSPQIAGMAALANR